MFKYKLKRVRFFSNFCIWRRHTFFFVGICPKRDGKLVNISVSVDARMRIFYMNTNETRFEMAMIDV